MKDFILSRRGQYLQTGSEFSGGNQTHLLHSDPGFEATIDIVPKGTVGCLYSPPTVNFEFNYILKGKLELFGAKEKALLESGDTFTYYALQRNYMFRALEDTEMLCIKKEPDYPEQEDFVNHLNEVLSQLQEADGDTLEHCERVKSLSMGIAYYLRYDPSKLLTLFYAAKFHDVGKAKIPIDILLKPGKLTDEEYAVMKEHSRYTYEMIREYHGEEIALIAFEHHEKLDGTGYPRGLRDDQISMPARIICVADAYDAMTVTRPYRKGLSREEAIRELRRCEGTQFDGRVVDALERYLEENT